MPRHTPTRECSPSKNPAYLPAIEGLKAEGAPPKDSELRQVKYLNNLVEQDHRFIIRRVGPGLGFFCFKAARRTIRGYEVMLVIRKGQIVGIGGGEKQEQVSLVASVFGIAA